MAVLSRHLSTVKHGIDFAVGTPPNHDQSITLGWKLKSDLNLATLSDISGSSTPSDFSTAGDPLPDEIGELIFGGVTLSIGLTSPVEQMLTIPLSRTSSCYYSRCCYRE
jgi:hypothetical protein